MKRFFLLDSLSSMLTGLFILQFFGFLAAGAVIFLSPIAYGWTLAHQAERTIELLEKTENAAAYQTFGENDNEALQAQTGKLFRALRRYKHPDSWYQLPEFLMFVAGLIISGLSVLTNWYSRYQQRKLFRIAEVAHKLSRQVGEIAAQEGNDSQCVRSDLWEKRLTTVSSSLLSFGDEVVALAGKPLPKVDPPTRTQTHPATDEP